MKTNKKIKLKKRIYIKKFRVIFFLFLAFFFTSGLKLYKTPIQDQKIKYEIYTVKENDTLWKIASIYIGDDCDKRNYIDKVEEINNLGNNIHPGQELKMPVIIK